MALPAHLETDYLIVGAGATGMGFADVILSEDPAARIVIVDRRADPGGHWNDAYAFVRLHQPAAYYGLNSEQLGQGGGDLTSGAAIVAYYKKAMDRFLQTGRVQFLSMCEYEPEGRIVSKVDSGGITTVTARRRVVDSTYAEVGIPSLRSPRYAVDPDVSVVPPNELVRVQRPWERYVVVGAGKTGIDAVLFLLDRGVSPSQITWIASNDAWLWDRATVEPGRALGTIVSMVQGVARADTIDEAFLQLEREGIVCRVDTSSLPTKWRCATVSREELSRLRSIEDVVRMGRVQRVDSGELHLDGGTVDIGENSLVIDCTANGLASVPPQPLFSEGRITVQSVFMCQQTFSAGLLAHLELLDVSDHERNRICRPVPNPELIEHMPSALLTSLQNLLSCSRRAPVWVRRSRLNMAHYEPLHSYLLGTSKLALLQRRAVASMNAMALSRGQADAGAATRRSATS
jgi:hypothetical protein